MESGGEVGEEDEEVEFLPASEANLCDGLVGGGRAHGDEAGEGSDGEEDGVGEGVGMPEEGEHVEFEDDGGDGEEVEDDEGEAPDADGPSMGDEVVLGEESVADCFHAE